jgi:acetolactate synthase-1/2/3 large subunit
VRVIFGLPACGSGVMAALRDGRAFAHRRHEQATSLADGTRQAGEGNFGGLHGSGPGLADAASGSSRVLGHVARPDDLGADLGQHRQASALRSATISTPSRHHQVAPASSRSPDTAAVREAVRQLKTGRPRPVEVELSPDHGRGRG